jgi:hypothetical protein
MCQYIINLVPWDHMISAQSTLAGATTFGAPNMKIEPNLNLIHLIIAKILSTPDHDV